ncbi:MAG: hypothetical protein AAGA28_06120 [Pseudomonadota bacterium]
MPQTKLSAQTLMDRIETLTHRKARLEDQIERDLRAGTSDDMRLARLRQETLGLRDAIRVTRTVLSQTRARAA